MEAKSGTFPMHTCCISKYNIVLLFVIFLAFFAAEKECGTVDVFLVSYKLASARKHDGCISIETIIALAFTLT